MAEAGEEVPPYSLDEVTAALGPFLGNNPASQLEFVAETDVIVPHSRILMPWGDPTLLIMMLGRPDHLIAALNRVLLPAKFSALWHVATSQMEVIWTAAKLADHHQEIVGRDFTLTHEGKKFSCRFGDSSDDLVTIAGATFPRQGPSETNLRNLQSFYQFDVTPTKDRARLGIDKPRSFWVEGFVGTYDEEAAVELARKINFFLTYYDKRSPSILIHTDAAEAGPVVQPVRYISGTFPKEITAPSLDENLLSFWTAANSGNEILRFMLYYRIMEYAAYHFVEYSAKVEIKKVLADPSLLSNLDDSIGRIVGVMSGVKDDGQRLASLFNSAIDPEVLWMEIDLNRQFFQKECVLDGGFLIPPLIGEKETLEIFSAHGVSRVAGQLRNIRNVLSHGKDQTSKFVITPTVKNLRSLRPWVHLAAKAAGEVVIYKDVA